MPREEVEEAVLSLKAGKSPGVDNISSELLKNGGKATRALTPIYKKIWETKEWPKKWAQSLVIALPKKDNLKQCKNYQDHAPSLSSTDSRSRLRNCCQRNKQVLDQAGADLQ